ncbi:MAG: BBP7 family outer membrane beta-barrel protein [Pirellulales bacterium]
MSRFEDMQARIRQMPLLLTVLLAGCGMLGTLEARALAQTRSAAGQSVMRTPRTTNVAVDPQDEPAMEEEAEGEAAPTPAKSRPKTAPVESESLRSAPRVPKAPARDVTPENASEPPSNYERAPSREMVPELAEPSELMEEPWAEPLQPQTGWWAGAEYILWWRRGMGLPPLVTTSPLGTPAQDAGILGGDTTVLYGNQTVVDQARPGGRLSFGWWADAEQTRGWMARTWFLAQSTSQFDASQSDYAILARPFLDVTGTPEQNSLLVAYPAGAGNIQVQAESDVIGGDALWRQMIYISPRSRVDLLLGYQFATINDSLLINSVSDPTTTPFQVTDMFSTRNEFHGGALGLMFVYDRPGVRLDLLAKVGLGNMHQSVQINGLSNGASGGLLAQATNIGMYSRDTFSVAPELGATVTWFLTDSIEFSLGYSLLYFTNVTQSNMAIDPELAVNLSVPFAGAARPEFVFQDDDFWIHGVNFGVTFRY